MGGGSHSKKTWYKFFAIKDRKDYSQLRDLKKLTIPPTPCLVLKPAVKCHNWAWSRKAHAQYCHKSIFARAIRSKCAKMYTIVKAISTGSSRNNYEMSFAFLSAFAIALPYFCPLGLGRVVCF